MKRCFKCRRKKPASAFYRHPFMADGHLGKCKACTKADTKRNYEQNRSQHAVYERKRFQTPARKTKISEYQRRRRERHPLKDWCRQKTSGYIRRGILTRQPCRVCGNPKSEAHHDDYRKPLEIRWLCFKHHRAEHGQRTIPD